MEWALVLFGLILMGFSIGWTLGIKYGKWAILRELKDEGVEFHTRPKYEKE